jgi:hypothetical protein
VGEPAELLLRARALGRTLESVAEIVDKYRLLEALRLGEPGRTIERREAMRAIAERFPGALREWDEASLEEIQRRRTEAEFVLGAMLDGAEAGSAGLAERDWLRFSMLVHGRLRRALRIKRWLGGRAIDDALARDAEVLHEATRAELEAIAEPPSRRISESIYRQVAEEEGISVEALKAALFPGETEGPPRSPRRPEEPGQPD